MHDLYELKTKLIKELEDYAQNGKFSKDDVEVIKYMASAVDHLCNIMDRDGNGEYSNRGGSSYRYSYAQRRDARGRYSRTDGAHELVEEIRSMMGELPQHVQQDAQRLIQKLENEY